MTSQKQLREFVVGLIYHGRNFSKSRDEVVIKKAIDYINKVIEEEEEWRDSKEYFDGYYNH